MPTRSRWPASRSLSTIDHDGSVVEARGTTGRWPPDRWSSVVSTRLFSTRVWATCRRRRSPAPLRVRGRVVDSDRIDQFGERAVGRVVAPVHGPGERRVVDPQQVDRLRTTSALAASDDRSGLVERRAEAWRCRGSSSADRCRGTRRPSPRAEPRCCRSAVGRAVNEPAASAVASRQPPVTPGSASDRRKPVITVGGMLLAGQAPAAQERDRRARQNGERGEDRQQRERLRPEVGCDATLAPTCWMPPMRSSRANVTTAARDRDQFPRNEPRPRSAAQAAVDERPRSARRPRSRSRRTRPHRSDQRVHDR